MQGQTIVASQMVNRIPLSSLLYFFFNSLSLDYRRHHPFINFLRLFQESCTWLYVFPRISQLWCEDCRQTTGIAITFVTGYFFHQDLKESQRDQRDNHSVTGCLLSFASFTQKKPAHWIGSSSINTVKIFNILTYHFLFFLLSLLLLLIPIIIIINHHFLITTLMLFSLPRSYNSRSRSSSRSSSTILDDITSRIDNQHSHPDDQRLLRTFYLTLLENILFLNVLLVVSPLHYYLYDRDVDPTTPNSTTMNHHDDTDSLSDSHSSLDTSDSNQTIIMPVAVTPSPKAPVSTEAPVTVDPKQQANCKNGLYGYLSQKTVEAVGVARGIVPAPIMQTVDRTVENAYATTKTWRDDPAQIKTYVGQYVPAPIVERGEGVY